MNNSTRAALLAAIPDSQDLSDIVALLVPHWLKLLTTIRSFRQQPATPESTCAFENALLAASREANRVIVDHVFNRLEPERRDDCPLRLRYAGEEYRRRPKSRNRISTLFGEIDLYRYLYEACEPGEPSLFPLEIQLGIEGGLATPALAERVGRWAVDHEQEQVRRLLLQEHNVSLSVDSVRKLTTALRDGLASFREPAQVARLLELLEKAFASQGRHRPVLAVGRDGVTVPIRRDGYHEGSTATVSVTNRRGKRLGTVYLGQMPQSGQGRLSAQMTSLITKVLAQWCALGQVAPRLEYVTDAGGHSKEYYLRVLRHMDDPWRPGHKLVWQWVVDFWHACGYVSKLAEALFGGGATASGWFAKWRHWLRDRDGGVTEVLRSVMWHYNNRKLCQRDDTEFWEAYGYLRRHAVWMKYSRYRQQGMPIGSGVTEAACKTVFTERLKRSGMTWCHTGGQVILDLRVLVLSKVWHVTHEAYLRSRPQPSVSKPASQRVSCGQTLNKAA